MGALPPVSKLLDMAMPVAANLSARRRRARPAVVLVAVALWLAGAFVAAAEDIHAPDGELTIDGAGRYVGTLGSNCVTTDSVSGCSDSPWLTPLSGPSARASADMTFRLSDGSQITSWIATYGDASVPEPIQLFLAGEDEADLEALSFTGPPNGDWVVNVFVRFHNTEASGDASYYFRIHAGVPETDMASATSPRGTDPVVPLALVAAAALGAVVGWRVRRAPHRSRPQAG